MSEDLDGIRIAWAAGRDDALAMAALTLRWDLEGGAPKRDGFLDEFADGWLAQEAVRPGWLARRPNGDPVGFAIGALVTSLPSLRQSVGGWLHVSLFYVAPEMRRHGLGERLMEQIVQWSSEHGVYRLQLNAADEARGLYRRAGFGSPQDTLMQLVLSDRLPTT